MALGGLLTPATVRLDLGDADKWTALERLVDLIMESGRGRDRAAILSAVVERERKGSTGLENGVAIPHARCEGVSDVAVALGVSQKGLDFDAANGMPCKLVFLIVAPPQQSTRYLQALSAVASVFKQGANVARLASARSKDDVINIVKELCEEPPLLSPARSQTEGKGSRG